MRFRVGIVWSAFLLFACKPKAPELGEPFVSEQIVGDWIGDWTVESLLQEGEASLNVQLIGESEIAWLLWMQGGPFTNDDRESLEISLEGSDDTDKLVLSGEVEVLGAVTIEVDKEGSITGVAIPEDIPQVDVVGYVNENEVFLSFMILGIFEGQAMMSHQD